MTVSSYAKVTLHVHPEKTTDHTVVVEKGGILEIVNDYHDAPEFEVQFINSAPPSPEDKLSGTVGEPVILHMPNELVELRCCVLYKEHKHGKCLHEVLLFARTCGPCQ
jgi:hypothetical protein